MQYLNLISFIFLLPAAVWSQEQFPTESATNPDPNLAASRRQVSENLQAVIIDYGRLIVQNCPPMLCTGLDCALVTERNGCQLCACPIGSPARGCDPMPFVLWHDLMVKGCPTEGGDVDNRDQAQKVTRWFRRVNRFTGTDQCESYVFPYCQDLDYNLWRSPRTKEECEFYCYSFEEQKLRGNAGVGNGVEKLN